MQFDIRRLDIYRKVPKDLTQPTLTGAMISVCSCLFITYLFVSELREFLTVEVQSVLTVEDPVTHSEKIPVFINITLPNMACEYVGLDIQDDMGRHEVGFRDNTHKEPLNEGKGCRFESHFLINKVPGNFHVSTHSAKSQPENPDMTHIVHKLRFGMDLAEGKQVKGSFNALENVDKRNSNALTTHDYILRVVPSVYEDRYNNIRFPFQYTYSYRDMMQMGHGGHIMPAIWFRYELSPITVRYTEKTKPFYTFLVMICAIIGGTFTVAGIIDGFIFSASELIKKAELGKLS
ncbi:endoplasmic reticulum-Golgi intermediate compartment protein 1-like [Physella acuta]|uniref:endoplasmic reticulum-Golgi intermediate compartment protein 1-like n=1 Tax=Physella acuta TaxID=109671 RepID=UPI0027DCB79A|nr:endoplasmic reticulum-Golgi intermediate compartment protein 1-like [Physella acuta]XP_059175925.1 endoplasmic reticulum-Golgi intermediate compartment protein 1-like [Physella acuta]XP_059175932.1 endoplasmic reticulum-Golgi intermediate compartment protein 1-like [Physella acuta]XP_059175940.1 endoplasmic reticulum-Golgi intermediate compartment protein 1-like [Physella acuta]XP_059175946.1 endoplasmic reticulum-Golgi intermediate compartment protein 1-like [Physella acuta]XP_059175955.1 